MMSPRRPVLVPFAIQSLQYSPGSAEPLRFEPGALRRRKAYRCFGFPPCLVRRRSPPPGAPVQPIARSRKFWPSTGAFGWWCVIGRFANIGHATASTVAGL